MTPLSSQHLLGFDLRVSPEANAAETWSQDLRRDQLINPLVQYPISVDEGAWAKVDEATYQRAIVSISSSWGMDPSEIENLAVRLLSRVSMEWLASKTSLWQRAWFIAISASQEELSDLRRDYGPRFIEGLWQEVDLERIAAFGWRLLGYDVAGRTGGISGLCGTAFAPNARAEVVQFESELNRHGLFSDLRCAERFAAIRELQIPEHAPLRPFGIWSSPMNRPGAEAS